MEEARNIDGTLEEEQVAVSRARELHGDMASNRSRSVRTSHWGFSTLGYCLRWKPMSPSPSDHGLGDDNRRLSHSAGVNEHSPHLKSVQRGN